VVPVLIDTDPGIDDALALLLAFRAPGWRVEALTVVAGNVPVDVGVRNVARILRAVGPPALPRVAIGPAGPRARPLVTATHFHGEDGLGGVSAQFPEAPLDRYPGDAADLLLASAQRWPGELTIVMLGPLTNLAAAIDRNREVLRRARAVVVMGGAVGVPGNVTPAAEYNVFVDPEAAALVLAADLPLTLVPLDVTREVLWPADRVERLRGAGGPAGRFAYTVARAGLHGQGSAERAALTMHDPLAVGVALDPTLVETEVVRLTVETASTVNRGKTAMASGGSRCRVALRVDAERFLRRYEESLWPACA
jgi:inosine-uridine nucleoside N-ribohydrolase